MGDPRVGRAVEPTADCDRVGRPKRRGRRRGGRGATKGAHATSAAAVGTSPARCCLQCVVSINRWTADVRGCVAGGASGGGGRRARAGCAGSGCSPHTTRGRGARAPPPLCSPRVILQRGTPRPCPTPRTARAERQEAKWKKKQRKRTERQPPSFTANGRGARRRVATAGKGGGGHPVATRPCMASRAAGAPAGDAKRPPAQVSARPCAALVQGTGGRSAEGSPAPRAPCAPMSTAKPLNSGGVGTGGSTEPLTVLVSREPKRATGKGGPIRGKGALPPASIRSVNARCGVA